jgi:hypothetical protein
MWYPRRLATPWALTACYGDSFLPLPVISQTWLAARVMSKRYPFRDSHATALFPKRKMLLRQRIMLFLFLVFLKYVLPVRSELKKTLI